MNHLLATSLAALCLALPLSAQSTKQTTTFTDPANLRGERVAPLTGRELPIDKGALGLEELLRKLNTRASILNIVAHPDDEDGGMLTLYARGYGARVADLSLTRGEGGQNAATSDFDDALGLLRTAELLSNDRYTGVSQMFGTEVDFGFSKTKAESFAKWTHQRVLYDAVRAIRLYRPLVITATFIGNPTDGHGQHQVSGEIAQEAFVAAGDPSVFPELTKEDILPWQPLRMYARVPTYAISSNGLFDYATGHYVPAQFTNYVTGVTSTTPPSADIVIHEGADDPLLTTCAANASDLPPSLRAASDSSNLSSRPEPSTANLSSRPERSGVERPAVPASASATDCRPLSYVQFARIGLGLQRTQIGPGVRNAPSGRFDVPYHLYGSRIQAPTARLIPAQGNALGTSAKESERAEGPFYNSALTSQPSFFDGIDTSIESIATLAPDAPPALASYLHAVADKIMQAQQLFDPNNFEASAPPLSDAGELLTKLVFQLKSRSSSGPMKSASWPEEQRQNVLREILIKQVQVNDALVLALGLHLDATTASNNGNIVAGSAAPVSVTLTSRSQSPLKIVDIQLLNGQRANGLPKNTYYDFFARPLPSGSPYRITITMASAGTITLTRPYFSRANIEQPFYDLNQPALRNAPQTPHALVVRASIAYRNQPGWYLGRTITLERIVHNGPQPVSIVPAYSIGLSSHAQVLPTSNRTFLLGANVVPATPSEHLIVHVPADWTMHPYPQANPPNEKTWSFDLIEVAHEPKGPVTIPYSVSSSDGQTYTEGFRPVGYGDLPRTNIYTPATDRIVPVDLKLPEHHRIGYLPGTGDAVPAALASIGLKPTMLTVADLTSEKLSHFDTVILGVRTYNAHPELHGAPTEALLNFARSGGSVLVQYQTREFTAADAPFPLSLGSDEKVVDETAPVEILHTDSTRFTTPNHINTTDFDHWIEERGHGFLGSWDPRYTALTETHDPGQLPQRGGLITTQLGHGHWTYCAFALYRQLPEAVPGAYRLFVNLLTP